MDITQNVTDITLCIYIYIYIYIYIRIAKYAFILLQLITLVIKIIRTHSYLTSPFRHGQLTLFQGMLLTKLLTKCVIFVLQVTIIYCVYNRIHNHMETLG